MPAMRRAISRRSALTWADTERGHGPVGKAIRTREPAVFRDVTRDPDFAPWARGRPSGRGYASVVGIPLLSGSEGLGGPGHLCRGSRRGFDDDEMQLLRELADDLSYGIVALRTRSRVPGGGGSLKAGARRARTPGRGAHRRAVPGQCLADAGDRRPRASPGGALVLGAAVPSAHRRNPRSDRRDRRPGPDQVVQPRRPAEPLATRSTRSSASP